MRFYARTHKHYCGIDLHARTMYVCVLSQEGVVLLHRNLRCDPEEFLRTIAPYRDDLVVAVECIFTWYWIADLCTREGIAFVLGHALYMRAIHGAKAKNDRIDSRKTAGLLRGGMMPQGLRLPARDESDARFDAEAAALRAPPWPAPGPHPEHPSPVQPTHPGQADHLPLQPRGNRGGISRT
jgi:hypothetical protein